MGSGEVDKPGMLTALIHCHEPLITLHGPHSKRKSMV